MHSSEPFMLKSISSSLSFHSKIFSFTVRLQTILTEILIIELCLWSYQQMAKQDLPLVSYGFLTGFRGISDPAAPCTFNTGFRLTRSQVGRVGPLPATHFAKMEGEQNRAWIRKLYLCVWYLCFQVSWFDQNIWSSISCWCGHECWWIVFPFRAICNAY